MLEFFVENFLVLSKHSTSMHNQIERHQQKNQVCYQLLHCVVTEMRLLFLCIYFLVCLLYFFWLGSNEYESSQAKLFFTQTRFDHEPLNFIWSNKNQQQQTQKQDHSTAINCLFFSLSIATSSPKISPRIIFHISATHHMPKNSPKWKSCSSPSVCLS